MCSYMRALGKMIIGSGFEEILVESGIWASRSIAKVLLEKHYNRPTCVHQRMTEVLEKMLLDVLSTAQKTLCLNGLCLKFKNMAQHIISKIQDVEDHMEFIGRWEHFKNEG